MSLSLVSGLLRNGGKGTDDDVAHLVPVQRGDYGGSVQFGFTGSLLVAHATSSAGVACRKAEFPGLSRSPPAGRQVSLSRKPAPRGRETRRALGRSSSGASGWVGLSWSGEIAHQRPP